MTESPKTKRAKLPKLAKERPILQPDDVWVTPKEIAAAGIGGCYQTVLEALRSGELPGCQFNRHGNWFIKHEDAKAWLDLKKRAEARGRPRGSRNQRVAA